MEFRHVTKWFEIGLIYECNIVKFIHLRFPNLFTFVRPQKVMVLRMGEI